MSMLKRGAWTTYRSEVKSGGFADISSTTDGQKVKELRKEGKEAYERFQREIQIIRGLSHDNIIKISSVGEDGRSYTMSAYDLDYEDYLATLPASWPIDALKQIFAGMAYLHRQGIIHRDLKPANILVKKLADGSLRVVIADFGLAKDLKVPVDDGLTKVGRLPDSGKFSAPEIVNGTGSVDKASDIYSLGMVVEETYNILNKNQDVEIRSIIGKALAYKPEGRYQFIEQFEKAFFSMEAIVRGAAAGNPSAQIDHINKRYEYYNREYQDNNGIDVRHEVNQLLEQYMGNLLERFNVADDPEFDEAFRKLLTCQPLQQYFATNDCGFGHWLDRFVELTTSLEADDNNLEERFQEIQQALDYNTLFKEQLASLEGLKSHLQQIK